jgi:hypothetical protein
VTAPMRCRMLRSGMVGVLWKVSLDIAKLSLGTAA